MFCSVSRAAARLSAPTDSSRPLPNQQHDKFLVSSPGLIRQKLERGNEHIKSRKEARPGSEGENNMNSDSDEKYLRSLPATSVIDTAETNRRKLIWETLPVRS
jgi:hypothetical protein